MEIAMAMNMGGFGKMLLLVAVLVFAGVVLRARAAGTNETSAAWSAIGQGALLVDVRTEEEFKGGALAGAINVPHDRVGKRLSEFGADKDRTIVVYCRSGRRSGLAKAELEQNGFKKVINAGGIGQLQAAKPTK